MFTTSFIGNLGQDAKMFTGKNGREMMGFSVGVSQPNDRGTLWVDVTMNHRPNLMPYLTKGTKVYVHGDCSIVMTERYLNVNVFSSELELLGERPAEQAPIQGVPSPVPAPDPDPFAPTM